MKKAIDLYSGIGGWTLGMKLSGVKNVASFEWWNEANQTHNLNFHTHHKEIDIRSIDVQNDLNFLENIDFVVGSPPCTQFSFANRGGNGDIKDGLVDVYKFLEIVEFLQPKYWAMENIPRVASILQKELDGGSLERFANLVKVIRVVDAADYGVPQNRKRMIAGNFPIDLFDGYKTKIKTITLGEVLSSLKKETITDPNYGYSLPRKEVTELENEVDLTPEEERINRDAKTFHPIYNKMAFPDLLDRPSRTVTATCTRVSRESIIVKSHSGFRRLNVRERGVLQGFPITYQFYGRTLNSKFKMIGNAVPPILTYYVFKSMLECDPDTITPPYKSKYVHSQPIHSTYKSNLGLPKRKYPANRKFQFSVPNLRYGSGVRFELSNIMQGAHHDWSFKFFFGNSKNIKQLYLDQTILESLEPTLNQNIKRLFKVQLDEILNKYKSYTPETMQRMWVSVNGNGEVFQFIDDIGKSIAVILEKTNFDEINTSSFDSIVKEKNDKLTQNKPSIIAGMYFLSKLNIKLFKK